MINANELRIGNLIMTDEFYLKVLSIHNIQDRGGRCDAEYSRLDDKKYFGLSQFYLDSSNPIPLTPEILEKAGFVYEKVHSLWCYQPELENIEYRLKEFPIGTWIVSKGFINYNHELTNIKYFHQLQNLYFALTGEELNIQL